MSTYTQTSPFQIGVEVALYARYGRNTKPQRGVISKVRKNGYFQVAQHEKTGLGEEIWYRPNRRGGFQPNGRWKGYYGNFGDTAENTHKYFKKASAEVWTSKHDLELIAIASRDTQMKQVREIQERVAKLNTNGYADKELVTALLEVLNKYRVDLTEMNDNGANFTEIADPIEKHNAD
jgi:hypothetical protein